MLEKENGKPSCSYIYKNHSPNYCLYDVWWPNNKQIDNESPYCIFHSPNVHEKIKEFEVAWESILYEHSENNQKEKFSGLMCEGFIFPIEIEFIFSLLCAGINFSYATFEKDANFENTRFHWDANFRYAKFVGRANFKNSIFYSTAHFEHAKFLSRAMFPGTKFLRRGIFDCADFTGANLTNSNFENCRFENVKYEHFEKLSFCMPNKWSKKYKFWEFVKIKPAPTNFTGIETKGILASSNRWFIRHIEDQQFINRFKKGNKWWYRLWFITSNCGQSFNRFFFWCFTIAVIFGFIFMFKRKDWFNNYCEWSKITPFYYSLVTFSTLGFGDITPKLNNTWAQLAVMIEVFFGYLGLGALLSILANKFARRS